MAFSAQIAPQERFASGRFEAPEGEGGDGAEMWLGVFKNAGRAPSPLVGRAGVGAVRPPTLRAHPLLALLRPDGPSGANGKPEIVRASEQIGRPLVKAWNALLAQTLAEAGTEPGTANRIAIPISGDDAAAKALISDLVSIIGFDTVDAGPLADSWKLQPGTPAYCTELTADELKKAISAADKDRAPRNRDAIMASFSKPDADFTRAGAVATNRSFSA